MSFVKLLCGAQGRVGNLRAVRLLSFKPVSVNITKILLVQTFTIEEWNKQCISDEESLISNCINKDLDMIVFVKVENDAMEQPVLGSPIEWYGVHKDDIKKLEITK